MAGKWWNLAAAIILSSFVGVGETAAEAPFLVSNKHGGRKKCHGTVVDNQHILLPASCLEYINPKTLTVVYADVGVGETAAEAPFLDSNKHGGREKCYGTVVDNQHILLPASCLEYINPKTLTVVNADVGVEETAAPFIVSILHGGRKLCHGTVVDNQHIYLHALFLEGIDDPKTLTVVYASGETRGVINFMVYPTWDPSTMANGAAMLKVDCPVTFSEDIQPVRFADEGEVGTIVHRYRDEH